MNEIRIRFKKSGRGVYISHLDLMRTMQRVFVRAGIKIKHTEGFNPHPYIVFALPLSVGVGSECELMDFRLVEGDATSPDEIRRRLSAALPEGVEVTDCYPAERKFKDIVWLSGEGIMEYDSPIPDGAAERLSELFSSRSLVVEKRSKRQVSEQDIIPMIKRIDFRKIDNSRIMSTFTIAAQNPTLNPELLISAVKRYLPDLATDFVSFRRTNIFGGDMTEFR